MAEKKKRVATRTDAVVAAVVGAFLTTGGVAGLSAAIAAQSEQIDSRVALIITGLSLLTIAVVDWRTAGVEEPAQPWPRIRRVAKWSSIVTFLAAMWFAQPDESRENREGMRMRSALSRLADAESVYFAANGAYTTDLKRLQATIDYDLSDTVVTIARADGSGWEASVRSLFRGVDRTCSMSVRREGNAARRDGPRCTR